MKNYKRFIAGAIAVAISAGATGSVAYAKNLSAKNAPAAEKQESEAASDSERAPAEGSSAKDETVYVLCNSDASVKNVIVSDWLKNTGASTELSDISSLADIVNVKGNESFSQTGESLDWKAKGSDIYYKGTTDKQPPVTVKISYFLDGKSVSPEELKGRSGHVTIRWDYTNTQKSVKEINGEMKEIYVPFMAASAAVLDTDRFLNVQVTNGKVISDGERLIIAGAAFPGLSDSLGLEDTKEMSIDIPDYIEVSADVTDFRTTSSVTVVSNEIFSELKLDDSFDFGDLTAKLKELTEGADKLENGTAELYKGMKELSSKSGDLTDGVDKLYNGSDKLKNGAKELADGSAELAKGAKTLSDSTAELSNGVKDAKDGSKQLTDGIGSAKTGASELSDGAQKVNAGASSLSDGIDSAKAGSDELVNGFAKVNEGTSALSSGAEALTSGVGALADGGTKVSAGSKQLSGGMGELSKGASTISSSAAELSAGITSAKNGADSLTDGITAAKNGAEQLAAGSSQLEAGSEKLAE
ncbi:MAG TPA: hypothetical protein PLS20_13170, partial [Ruminococcus flavefaciens]|nr:hypothetical protein [Ruminococcus flavefaciens]